MKSESSLNLSHVGLKTRSQAQMSLCLYYRAPDKHGLDKLNFLSKISQELQKLGASNLVCNAEMMKMMNYIV